MINIQKFYSVHFSHIRSILSSSVHFGPNRSIPFTLVLFHLLSPIGSILFASVQYGLIQSCLVEFDSIRSIMSTLVLIYPVVLIRFTLVPFGPNWSTLSFSDYFGPIQPTLFLFGPLWSYLVRSIMSTLVLIYPFIIIRSYSVYIGPLCSIQSTSVLFGLPCSHSVHFCSYGLFLSTSIHFGSLQSIFVRLHRGKRHIQVESTYSKSKFIKK